MSHGSSETTQDLTVKATGEEARNYDYAAARENIKKTNVFESIGHLVKSCLGGGVVGIHEAYKKLGLIPAVVLNLILGIFVGYCMKIIVGNAQVMYGRLQIPAMSYPDLAEATVKICPIVKLRRFGKCLSCSVFSYLNATKNSGYTFLKFPNDIERYAVDVTICINLFGSCCVYTVLISRSIKQLLEESRAMSDVNIRILIACLMIPCILICMITEFKYLAPVSIVADVFLVTVTISTIYYGSTAAKKSPSEFPVFKDFDGFLEFLGVCVFSMEGVGVMLPIENHMKEPKKFPLVLFAGIGCVIGIVTLIGFFGYWGWGEEAQAPVTNNFPWDVFPIILKSLMAITLYITFALNFWAPFNLLWVYIKKRHANNSKCKLCFWERLYRTGFIIVIILIAVAFPDVTSFMGFLGCFCISLLCFVFPPFIEICVIWEDPGFGPMKWRLVKNSLIIAFGVVLCITGTYANVKGLINAASAKKYV